jgi:hypothetical protein
MQETKTGDTTAAPATYSIAYARKKLGLSVNAAYRAAAAGEIPAKKFGRAWRVFARPFDEMVNGDSQKTA